MKKWILASMVFVMLLGFIAFLFIRLTPPPAIKLPNPNGYDDLLKASRMLSSDLPECYWSWSFWSRIEGSECYEQTRDFLNSNSEALKLVRLGLSRESRTPIIFTPAYFFQHMSELDLIKRLAQVLRAEGQVAEREKRVEDAIQSYLDIVYLREKMHDGIVIDTMVSMEIEDMGLRALRRLSADQMTVAQRHDVIKKLVRICANRESYDQIIGNERKYMNADGLKEQFVYSAKFFSRRKSEQNFKRKFQREEAHVRFFLVELGLHNFIDENDHAPKTLHELVPSYLPSLPQGNFIYTPNTNKGYEQFFGLFFKDTDGDLWDW